MARESRSRSQSFFEDEEDDDTVAHTPMPSFLDDDTPTPSPPPQEEDDVDYTLDENDQEINDRRRSRSFFDQTDVASGLKSALPPQVSADKKEPEKAKQPERTGKLNAREVHALKQGLQNEMQMKASRRDSDLDVDEEYERKMNIVNDTNHHSLETSRDTISQGSPIVVSSKHLGSAATSGASSPPPQRKVKILMLGDSGVGKTSLMSRWTEDTFNDNMIGTLGVDFKMKQIMIEGASVQVQVWDTAGQERFRKITRAYYKNAHGIILVYDTVSRETFENISYWMENIQEHSGGGVQVAVVGNKIDLREAVPPESTDVVPKEEAAAILEAHGDTDISFYETSAKNSTGVDQAFVDIISRVVRQQLDYESLMKEGDVTAAKGKKKKRFKTPKSIKKFVKGGKKVAKGEKCTIA